MGVLISVWMTLRVLLRIGRGGPGTWLVSLLGRVGSGSRGGGSLAPGGPEVGDLGCGACGLVGGGGFVRGRVQWYFYVGLGTVGL